MKSLRKTVAACMVTVLVAAVAFADIVRPIDLGFPPTVTAGTSAFCELEITGGNGTVQIQSSPSGVVNTTVSVHNGINTFSVPVASGYTGSLTVSATGGGQTVSTTTVVQ